MKAHVSRVFGMAAASICGVLISAVGCGAAGGSDLPVAEEQEAMSAEEESVTTDESALDATVATSTLGYPKGRGICFLERNCTGPSYKALLTAGACRRLGAESWRRSMAPLSRCINF